MTYKFVIFVPYYTKHAFSLLYFIRIAMLTNLWFSCHVTQLCPGNADPQTNPFHELTVLPCTFWI